MHDVRVLRDARIATAEPGVTLSADVFLPADSDPGPALLTVLPYRKDALPGAAAVPMFRWFAERGFACLMVELRGTGASDGDQRPPFDPAEVDDAIAALEWVVEQPWCNGRVGMWGASYAAVLAMRAAGRPPPQLKAILPALGTLDIERDFVHPAGARGGIAWLDWGVRQMIGHLLPPLHEHHSAEQQRRWRRRLDTGEPNITGFFRQGPGDPSWSVRAEDASEIELPALCVTGWRDVCCAGQIRAFEEMRGPKQLIVGPWMHTQPHESPFLAIDFFSVALRWWDFWLRGVDNGVLNDPPVRLYLQGRDPAWRAYDRWPVADSNLVFVTSEDATLAIGRPPSDTRGGATVIGEYRPDPTSGSLGGLWHMVSPGFGLPLDQHDDDIRGLALTSAPLAEDLLLIGSPTVAVRLARGEVERIVVRLADVDARGCSTLITTALTCVGEPAETHCVSLGPTAYRVGAGHRLRVILGDADFPRLWPVADRGPVRVTSVELRLATASPGTAVDMPVPLQAPPKAVVGKRAPVWRITRDPINDGVELVVGYEMAAYAAGDEHLIEMRHELRSTVRRESPLAAVIQGATSARVKLSTGEAIAVSATARLTTEHLWARGEVSIDGTTIFSRTWDAAQVRR